MRRSGERDPHAAAARIIGCRVHGAFEPSRDASRRGREASRHASPVPNPPSVPSPRRSSMRDQIVSRTTAGGGGGEAAGADPDAVAQSYWHVHAQDKSAWTQEMDIRSPSFM
ncbi:hypothetical protein EJB05_48720, partial [Eragrostis curvula]